MAKIRVLVVDDSFFMRKSISKILTTNEIEVIDTASNGKEAIAKAKLHNPDVITMDIEMPIMNGLDAVQGIMEYKPIPIIMLSTLTTEGATATVEALSRGAVDFITKKAAFTELNTLSDEITGKIKAVTSNKLLSIQLRRQIQLNKENSINRKLSQPQIRIKEEPIEKETISKSRYSQRPDPNNIALITIGISTGGPAALNELIPKLSERIPVPIIIAQHMPPLFTNSLAERLNSYSPLRVKEAEHIEKVVPGSVYICPGGKQTTIGKNMLLKVSEEPDDELFRPSVNKLIGSAVDSFGKNSVGIIMTGMGNDGSKSLKRLYDVGGYVISQDVDSCVVAGMPKAVIDLQIAHEIHSLSNLPTAINSLFNIKS